jgi:hypothetical protein
VRCDIISKCKLYMSSRNDECGLVKLKVLLWIGIVICTLKKKGVFHDDEAGVLVLLDFNEDTQGVYGTL